MGRTPLSFTRDCESRGIRLISKPVANAKSFDSKGTGGRSVAAEVTR
jgi:hypothetical protein